MEVFIDSILYSIIGFSIVFSVLLLLVVMVYIFNWADEKLVTRQLVKVKDDGVNKKMQGIDDTTLVLLSAAVATYFNGRAYITKVRVLPNKPRVGSSWNVQGRIALQGSHVLKK